MREKSRTFGFSYTTESVPGIGAADLDSPPCFLWFFSMCLMQVFPSLFCFIYRAVNVFLYSRSARYASCPTCEFKAQVFFCVLWSFDCGSTSTHPRAPNFSSDGEEMDDGKRLILVARTSVKLTNGSPKLGKPLADRGRSDAGPSPTDFHAPPFQSRGPCQATTWRRVLAPPHVPASLRCYQPACWHRAEPQSLMNRPSKETWRGRPFLVFFI